ATLSEALFEPVMAIRHIDAITNRFLKRYDKHGRLLSGQGIRIKNVNEPGFYRILQLPGALITEKRMQFFLMDLVYRVNLQLQQKTGYPRIPLQSMFYEEMHKKTLESEHGETRHKTCGVWPHVDHFRIVSNPPKGKARHNRVLLDYEYKEKLQQK